MKQIVILSGKGGAGKTSLSAGLAHLSSISVKEVFPVMVDADVDAANLSLVLQPSDGISNEFWGGSIATINTDLCNNCGKCVQVCRFDAILSPHTDRPFHGIDAIACDGCAACVYACPASAIIMTPQLEGNWFQSNTPYGELFHAELLPGRENSGKLVTLVKQKARLFAHENQSELLIIDGPPGIGCPVISACAGADLGLVVTEPGVAGIHDLKRVLATLQHFSIPVVICINKADIYSEGTRVIYEFAKEQSIEVLGEIPYDPAIHQAMGAGQPVTLTLPESPASLAIINIWLKLMEIFNPSEQA